MNTTHNHHKETSMNDPNQLFVVNAISRKGIAENLNSQLGREEFTEGDERLGDPLCKVYAAKLGEISEMDHEEDRNEAETELNDNLFSLFGLTPTDNE